MKQSENMTTVKSNFCR